MALREVKGPLGAPWERPLQGSLDTLVVESEVLQDNPLGDSARRPLYVYRPPGVGGRSACGDPDGGGTRVPSSQLPVVYVLQGFTGQLDSWRSRDAFELNVFERLDALFAAGRTPPGLIVFVDAWTSLGGSQFLNSVSTGRYLDYLCDEVVPFIEDRYGTLAAPEHRALSGKSSGGYGAMVVPMLRPEVFGALASHAGDALFEVCYLPAFARAARLLRDRFEGSYEVFFERLAERHAFDYSSFGEPLELYAYAAAYSPDEERPGWVQLPFETTTGRLVDEVWQRWLEHDPVRMVERHAEALSGMRRIYLDAGRGDEAHLDLGAQAFSQELARAGIDHTLELFDGRHSGISWRYPLAIHELLLAISA